MADITRENVAALTGMHPLIIIPVVIEPITTQHDPHAHGWFPTLAPAVIAPITKKNGMHDNIGSS